MLVAGGSTNVTTYFAMRLAADGTAATALTITNFDLQYVRSGAAPAAKVDATALAATDTAHTDNYAIEIDATDQPGLYRVDWPDAAFAAGVREVILSVKCATCFTEHLRVEIDPADIPAKMGSDVTLILAQHTKTQSDIVIVDDFLDTEVAAITSNLVIIAADTGTTLPAKIDSDITLVLAQHTKTQSDIVIVDNFLDTEIPSITSNLVIVASDTAAIELAGGALTAAQASDLVAIESELIKVYSDTTAITADTFTIQTDVSNLSTKQDSDMTVLALSHAKTQSDIVIVDDFLDTEVASITSNLVIVASDTAAIEVDTGTTLPAKQDSDITLVLAQHTKTQSDIVIIDDFLDTEVASITSNLVIIASDTALMTVAAGTIVTGAAEAGTLSTTQMTTDLTEATDDHYNGRLVIWTSGVLENQASDITDYTGSTGQIDYTAVTEAPTAGDTFVIV